MTSALVEFIRARLDDDRAAWSRPIRFDGQQSRIEARILSELDAVAELLVIHRPANLNPDGTPGEYSSACEGQYCRGCNANFVEEFAELLEECPTLRAVATIWADHPDYRQEWKP